MNVLVYAGPEVFQTSLKHTLSTLRSILIPHYTVQSISRESLASHPWSTTCALLVFPGCHSLTPSPSIAVIQSFVENGGALLALSSGATYSSTSRALDLGSLSISGLSRDQPLRFHDKSTSSYLYPKFHSGDPAISSVTLRLESGQDVEGVQCDGAVKFEGFDGGKNAKILAWVGESMAAVRCDMSKGKVAVWAPSIEVPVSGESVATPSQEIRRQAAMRDTLTSLGLHIPSGVSISHPLPQYLSVTPDRQNIISEVIKPYFEGSLKVLKENHDTDTLHLYDSESEDTTQILLEARSRSGSGAPSDPSSWQPKHVFVCRGAKQPADARYFDTGIYYSALSTARSANGLTSSSDTKQWGMGEALLYSEAVTSTQIMFDR